MPVLILLSPLITPTICCSLQVQSVGRRLQLRPVLQRGADRREPPEAAAHARLRGGLLPHPAARVEPQRQRRAVDREAARGGGTGGVRRGDARRARAAGRGEH